MLALFNPTPLWGFWGMFCVEVFFWVLQKVCDFCQSFGPLLLWINPWCLLNFNSTLYLNKL